VSLPVQSRLLSSGNWPVFGLAIDGHTGINAYRVSLRLSLPKAYSKKASLAVTPGWQLSISSGFAYACRLLVHDIKVHVSHKKLTANEHGVLLIRRLPALLGTEYSPAREWFEGSAAHRGMARSSSARGSQASEAGLLPGRHLRTYHLVLLPR
jgi:hypothetical protein